MIEEHVMDLGPEWRHSAARRH
ncbi:hypothetical protein [Vulcanisaeta distributa]|nr:hypothetical protein [Vulcanisaeta distributa]